MRKALAAVGVLAVLVAVAVVVLLHRGSKSTPALAPATVESTLAPGVLPRPGVHRYAQSGFEEAKVGPLKIHRTFPPRAVLVVSGAGDVVQEEWRYSQQHLEATRTRVTPKGRYSIWQRTRLTMVITQDEAHNARPVTLSRPNRMRVGQHWVQDYTVGGVHSVSRNRVTGRCGSGCYVVVADSTVSGAHPGTEREVSWESETTGLTIRETIDRHIGGTFPYRMHLEVRLIR
ncbi:MAG TPA: hypothetical protein VFJ93_02845 [Gaiellaceae bacterium]|nr:hypothetical protein [Gaiellaceae bacterium]